MSALDRRRPLPALVFIGLLGVLTAVVWFRVLHRSDSAAETTPTTCPSSGASAKPAPKLLPFPSRVAVLVLNSTERTGLAARTARQLKRDHYVINDVADDAPVYGGNGKPVPGVAEIRYGPGAKPAALLLRYTFPGATLTATDSSSTVVTLSLGAKYKQFLPFATVEKQVEKAGYTLTAKQIRTQQPTSSC